MCHSYPVVDTGAKKTFISLNAYKSIPYKNRPGLKPTKQQFIAANGCILQCDGETVIEMKFGEMEMFFPVIVGGVTQSLLGEDFIRHFKCNFDNEGRTFIISKGGMSYDKNSIKSNCKRLARVILADSIEIPPECEIVVPAHFKDKPINSDGILVPDTVLTVKHGLLLARLVVNSEQSSFCARFLNPGKDTVCIQKGTVLGLFEPVSDVEQCNINRTQEPVLHVADVNSQEELP